MLGLSVLPIKYWIPAREVVLLERAPWPLHNWIICFNVQRRPALKKLGKYENIAPSTCISFDVWGWCVLFWWRWRYYDGQTVLESYYCIKTMWFAQNKKHIISKLTRGPRFIYFLPELPFYWYLANWSKRWSSCYIRKNSIESSRITRSGCTTPKSVIVSARITHRAIHDASWWAYLILEFHNRHSLHHIHSAEGFFSMDIW